MTVEFVDSNKQPPHGEIVTSSICVKCNARYKISSNEVPIVPGMRLNKFQSGANKKILATWADWIDHIGAHCSKCRYLRPPQPCIDDLNRELDRFSEEEKADSQPDEGIPGTYRNGSYT